MDGSGCVFWILDLHLHSYGGAELENHYHARTHIYPHKAAPPTLPTRTFNMKSHPQSSYYVSQVYALAGAGCLVAACGARAHLEKWVVSGVPIVASSFWTYAQMAFMCLLTLGNVGVDIRGVSWWKLALFLCLGFSAGVNVGSWVEFGLQEAGICSGNGWRWFPDIDWVSKATGVWGKSQCTNAAANALILEVTLKTAGTYACFALCSAFSPRGWSFYFSSLLSAGMWLMLGSQLLYSFGIISQSIFDQVYVNAGLFIYSFKVMYDSDLLMQRAEAGYFDVVGAATTVLMNVLHMFIRIFRIIAQIKGEANKKKKR